MKTRKYLSYIAILFLLVAIASTLYVNAAKTDTTEISINGESFIMDQLFQLAEERTIEIESGATGSGIALDQLMVAVGIPNPEALQYNLIGADGYRKTVSWENLQVGVLTRDRETLFSGLPKAFNVKEIIEIKVE